MNKIEIKNLSKVFETGNEKIEVLKIKNAFFEENKTIAITGSSGSGKSTLLQIIAGLDNPSSGEVILTGSISKTITNNESLNISKLKNKDQNKIRKDYFGFIYQKNFLLKDLNVIDNLLIVKNDKDKAMELLNKVGLKDKYNAHYRTLSGGERQRVSICRALMNSPKFIFADEPTGSLDYKNKDKIWNLFLDLKKEINFGLIMVTHDQSLAKLCDKSYSLKNGELFLNN